jgi:hypothetical protein
LKQTLISQDLDFQKSRCRLKGRLTALCFEIAYSLLRKIVEREFQILTLMNFHEPLEIKCNFQQPSSSDSPLPKKGTQKISKKKVYFILILSSTHFHLMRDRQGSIS